MNCSSCGTTNPAGSLFCMSCGNRLAEPVAEAEDDYPMADFAGPQPEPATGPTPEPSAAEPGWGGPDAAPPAAPEPAAAWAPAPPVEPTPSWAAPVEPVAEPAPEPVVATPPPTEPEPSWAAPTAPAAAPPAAPAAPAAPAWQPSPPPVPTPGDPAALAVSAGRLAPTAAAAARTALVVTAAVLVPGEVVEAVATGSLSGVTGVIALTDRRLLAVNQQDWTPVVTWFSVDPQLSVQAWEDAQSATVVLTSGGSSITLDHITDRTPAYDLVARVRARTGQA